MNPNKFIILRLVVLSLFFGLFFIESPLYAEHVINHIKNEPDNFRGIRWGTNIKALSETKTYLDFIKINNNLFIPESHFENHIISYSKKHDELKVGDVNVEKISYLFYKDRFYKGKIHFHAISSFGSKPLTIQCSNYYEMREYLFYRFGRIEGKPPKEMVSLYDSRTHYKWIGDKITISLIGPELSQTPLPTKPLKFKVEFEYIPIIQEMIKDEQEKIKEAAEDF